MKSTAPDRRLTPPSPRGLIVIADGPKGRAQSLQMELSELEDALLLAGATPGNDYSFKDLMDWALRSKADAAHAEALGSIARALRDLGNGTSAAPFGAIEGLGIVLRDGLRQIADAVGDLGQRDD